MVCVASPGGLAAGREPAGQVSQVNDFAEPDGYLVGQACLGVRASTGGSICGRPLGCLPGSFLGGGDDRCQHRRDVVTCALAAVVTCTPADVVICTLAAADFSALAAAGFSAEVVWAHDDGDAAKEAAGLARACAGWS